MLTLNETRRLLMDRRLQVVAQATGIHYNTLKKIRDDDQANPTYAVIKLLSDYLEGKQDAA